MPTLELAYGQRTVTIGVPSKHLDGVLEGKPTLRIPLRQVFDGAWGDPIGIGDPSPARNVRIAELLAPENAFKEDPFSITVRLATQGIAGESLRVELRERDEAQSGSGRIVDTKTVRVDVGGGVEPLIFERRQQRVGRYAYTVTVPVLEAETVSEDNESHTAVNVIDARTRVLLVSGSSSWEYRYVSRLLQRDETFDVSVWLQSADLAAVRDGNTIVAQLPSLAELGKKEER